MTVEWGTVGEWMSGAAASVGLAFAALEIHASRGQRRDEEERRVAAEIERREAMARAVGVTGIPQRVDRSVYERGDPPPEAERWKVEYTVHNGGEYPIDKVVVEVLAVGGGESEEWRPRAAVEVVVGTVLGKQTYEGSVEFGLGREPAFAELTNMVSVNFTDTWNQSWHRAPGVLEPRDHPAHTC